MKRNKKMVMALSFCVGVALFGSTVFADISSKTGYDELKDAAKSTLETCSEKLQSFTLETSVTLKDNGKVLVSSNNTSKYDNTNKQTEDLSTSKSVDGSKRTSYSYRSQDCNIWYNSENDMYYVSEFTKKNESPILENPFKEDRAKDMEKIADALIGNLKDYVIVDNKEDGSKELSGSLSEAQIPALVNAFSSFMFKQKFSSRNVQVEDTEIPQIKDDIFIKNVSGKAVINKDGLMENLLASGMLSGKDKQGVSHDLAVEVLVKVVDVNTTSVSKPDLTGKKVEKRTETPFDQKIIPKKFIGKYKNDIIIEKDDTFVKVGERYIEIASIDDKHISGKYYDTYKDEFKAQYGGTAAEFKFDAEITNAFVAHFEYKENGYNLSEIYLDPRGARVNLGGSAPDNFDYSFSRVFD